MLPFMFLFFSNAQMRVQRDRTKWWLISSKKKLILHFSLYISLNYVSYLFICLYFFKSWILLFSKIHPNLFSFLSLRLNISNWVSFFSTSTTYSIDFCNISLLLCKLEVSSLKTNLFWKLISYNPIPPLIYLTTEFHFLNIDIYNL